MPELDRTTIDDLMLGCGLPGGEQGFNMGRVVAILAGMRQVPGCTITRYCASSLQTIRMAAHAIRSGEGDAFVAAGVEAVSRFGGGTSDVPGRENPKFAGAAERSAGGRGRPGPMDPGRGPARHLHRDGQRRRTWPRPKGPPPRGDGRLRARSHSGRPLPGERGLRPRDPR